MYQCTTYTQSVQTPFNCYCAHECATQKWTNSSCLDVCLAILFPNFRRNSISVSILTPQVTSYFEHPDPAIQVQTLPLEGPVILRTPKKIAFDSSQGSLMGCRSPPRSSSSCLWSSRIIPSNDGVKPGNLKPPGPKKKETFLFHGSIFKFHFSFFGWCTDVLSLTLVVLARTRTSQFSHCLFHHRT